MDIFFRTINILWLIFLTIGYHWQNIAIKKSCSCCEERSFDSSTSATSRSRTLVQDTKTHTIERLDNVIGEELSFDLATEDEPLDASLIDGYLPHQSDTHTHEPKISIKEQASKHDSHSHLHAQEKLQEQEKYIMDAKKNQRGFERHEVRELSFESYYQTSCALLESSDLDDEHDTSLDNITNASNDILTTFPLQFKLITDKKPHETSWTLLPHEDENEDNIIIDSQENDITKSLSSPHSLHEFNYFCTVSSNKLNEIKEEKNEPFCYDFKVYDSLKDGVCCNWGQGSYELKVNNDHIIDDRIFSYELSRSFCITNDGKVMDKEDESKPETEFPSRECINKNQCICDSNPALFGSFSSSNDMMYDAKMRAMNQMTVFSGTDKLMDITSPQYKAACWVLNDDPFNYDTNTTSNALEKIEERMIQRYILAVLYFSTTPKNWNQPLHFLSSRSECEWNTAKEFYVEESKYLLGVLCNDDETVFSIFLYKNNLDGTIIEEAYGLKKLEQFGLPHNDNLYGTIPSSLGRLPELRQLFLFQNALTGSIPHELSQASRLQYIHLGQNRLTGSIPGSLGKLNKLSRLAMYENFLSGSIPESLFMLKDLVRLGVEQNRLAGTISTLIGNMKNLRFLYLNDNTFTGEFPKSITQLSRLEELRLNNNEFSGSPFYLTSLSNLEEITLHDNNFEGSVSDSACEEDLSATADCRNDVFTPDVACPCCVYCTDRSPVWDAECADTTISIKFDNQQRANHDLNSDYLKWSLVDKSVDRKVLYDGPYRKREYQNDKLLYKACVVESGYFSLIMESPPIQDTNYSIFWNDELMHKGTFLGYEDNDDLKQNENETMVDFCFVEKESKALVETDQGALCQNVVIDCGGERIPIMPNTFEYHIYETAAKISGLSELRDVTSFQSKAFCWILTHNDDEAVYHIAYDDNLKERFTQRYTLTILHLMSPNGLFSTVQFPPLSHECKWTGVGCSKNIVKDISLSSEENQIIGGSLIKELGSLAFLEVLLLRETGLVGTVPQVLSNLYSLKELDLSSNSLSGSIPEKFFDQLGSLRSINFSYNGFTGTIPARIGSYSDVESIQLNNNQFIGVLPMEGFSKFNLQVFDVSENQLSGLGVSSPLLKHSNLAVLNLAANFFVGKIQEDMFVKLSKLTYFNVSRNEIDGIIPTKFTVESNITHLDIHDNRFSGTIPDSITNLLVLKHLNLQGNRLTGSIPLQLNELRHMETLAMGHNELKGSIPLDLNSLQNIDRLYLHNNKLSGEAPKTERKMKDYLTDCGFPSDSLEPVSCSSCNICCNSDGTCQKKRNETVSSTAITLIIIFSFYGVILLCYLMKRKITTIWFLAPFFSNVVKGWDGLFLISGRSVYHFMLTKNKIGWIIAVACSIFQMLTLFLFVQAADINSESGDLEYTMTCPANSLDCENAKSVSPYGIVIFSTIIGVWLLRDIISSLKLMLLSFEKKCIDFLFSSGVIFLVTILSLWTSVYYILAIATKNTDLIKDAVILLFVIEIDERIFQLAETISPDWVREIELDGSMRNMRDSMAYTGDDLLISSWIKKSSENFSRSIPSLRSFPSFPTLSKNRRASSSGRTSMVKDEHRDV